MRPIRFGLVSDQSRSRNDLIALARRVEAAGFSTLLLRDHVVEEPFGHQLGPLVAMTAAAMVTDTLRVGALVVANDFRPPVQLAKEIATLDVLSGGRVELGLGAGFLAAEYAPQGILFESAGVRVARLDEAIQVLKRLFAGKPVSFRGDHYCLDHFVGYPPSSQQPHPPLLVAGSGPRMLRLAAREADIVGVQTVTTTSGNVVMDPANCLADAVQAKVDLVREAAGDRFDRLELNTSISLVVTDDREAGARQLIAERSWRGVTIEDVLEMPSLLIGAPDEIAGQIRERRDRYGLSYLTLSEKNLDHIEPLVRQLAGS